MSNDRVVVKCLACGKIKVLFKYYPGDGSYMCENVEEWFDQHTHVCNEFRGGLNPNLFTIGNESLLSMMFAKEREEDDSSGGVSQP